MLHIGKYFPPYAGGMETYLRDLMTAQCRQGMDTAALVHRTDLSLRSQEEAYSNAGEKLTIVRAAVWMRALFTPFSPGFPLLLNRLLRRQRPDILHIHMPNVSAGWAFLVPRARKTPWVVHWHSDVLPSRYSPGLRLFYSLYRPLEQAILNRCSQIIVTSPPYLESSIALAKHRNKCHIVPLGLAPTVSAPPTVTDSTDRPLNILAVGRLTYYKGFEYLIDAMSRCEHAVLHLVGCGQQESELNRLVSKSGLGNRVTLHGHLSSSQLDQQFQSCDCLCLPSIERTEAFGMVLLEAMSHGKATIISKVAGSGMAWVVDDGITGLHVPPEDSAALADAIRYLDKNRDKVRLMGRNGWLKFDQQFHIDESAAGVFMLYKRALENNSKVDG